MPNYQNRESQISEREIERQYAKLEIRVADPDRVNCYVCPKGHVMKTIDVHHGVTPMFLNCDRCGAQATSSFYKDHYPDIEPGYQWVIPTVKEIMKFRRNPAMLDHIFRGGLELRKV